jgi:hypothetical protein
MNAKIVLARDVIDRFVAKVSLDGPVSAHRPDLGPCHIWTAHVVTGYGQFWLDGRNEYAHRVAFLIADGRWPEPHALHHCDNPPCVRRSHLFEGTSLDNNRDCIAKGRQCVVSGAEHWARQRPELHARGEATGLAKLTASQVVALRAQRASGLSLRSVADEFGVSISLVSMIANRRIWAHLP